MAKAYVADSVEPADRARALGWLSAATSAGVMFGPVIGSVAAHLGRATPGFVAAALCVVNVAFAWRLLPESHVEPRQRDHGAEAGLAGGVAGHPPPDAARCRGWSGSTASACSRSPP